MIQMLQRVPPVIRFALVGISGTAPNLAIIWLLNDLLGANYVLALVLGAQAGVIWNFLLTDRLVFPEKQQRDLFGRAWRFFLVGNLDLLARLPLTIVLVETLELDPVPAAAIVILAIFIVKWLLVSRVIWIPKRK